MTTLQQLAKKRPSASPHKSEEEQPSHQASETEVMGNDFLNLSSETISPRSAVQLQRVLGNQAVMRLLEKNSSPSYQKANASNRVINRYTTRTADNPDMQKWVGKYQRSSTNKGILQISEQVIAAKDEIIASSEQALAAQNSVVQLVKGAAFSPGYSYVKVQARASRIGSLKGDPAVAAMGTAAGQSGETNKAQHLATLEAQIKANKTSIADNGPEAASASQKKAMQESVTNMDAEATKLAHTGDTDIFLTIRDCHMTARLIMGDVGVGKPGQRRERMEITDNTGANKSVEPKVTDTNSQATTANRGAIGVLKAAFSTFESVLVTKGFGPDTPKAKTQIIADLKAVNGAWDYTAAMNLYKAIQTDADIKSLFNSTYSINEYAKVAIGQALVVVNDEREKKNADLGRFDGGRELWNYHWAGVILMDGKDYVTLEAVADQNATTLTTDWAFRMYGMVDRDASAEDQAEQAKQTFHGEQKTDTHTGTAPLTVGVKAS